MMRSTMFNLIFLEIDSELFMMALVLNWYDLICLAIVGASLFAALYVVWKTEFGSSGCVNELLVKGKIVSSNSQLWRSCWRDLHPGFLFGLRFSSLAILSGFLLWDIHTYDASIFLYYTEWTFTLVIIYFAIGTIVSAHGCYYSPSSNSNIDQLVFDDEEHHILSSSSLPEKDSSRTHEISEKAGFWGYLMQTTYQTCAGAVILTDIIFWCIIVPFLSNAHFQLNMLMGCMHTLNALLLIVDTCVNSLSFPWFRLAYFVVWTCCYVVFQWLIHACGFSWWPYPFLELSTPWAPLWYFGLAVLHIPCYGCYSLAVKAKYSLLPRLFPHSFLLVTV